MKAEMDKRKVISVILAQRNKKAQGWSRLGAPRGIVGIAATWIRWFGKGDRKRENRVNFS
jgi:hypothetical protein